MGGLLGNGAGMNYAFLFIIFLNFSIKKATGTGSLMMAIVMFVAAFLFFPKIHLINIGSFLVIGIIFSVIGTLIGLRIALKLSSHKMNFMIGFTLFITGLIISSIIYRFAIK